MTIFSLEAGYWIYIDDLIYSFRQQNLEHSSEVTL